ncbi:MAG: hypothetical protein DI587_03650 [Variovorax paradoxus]|nr:MAG: hypothetical protein DI583_03650 [Variovorax paradoxus]PZQ15170.1 MAG: hypothetical protein DI587_03650 [Variovorax paradoxus]HVR54939.1 hypothetical protein [Pseudorhodoferax sp.]
MSSVTDIHTTIEQRASQACAQDLQGMTQELLSLRTLLTLEHRAHADALLLTLDHLACERPAEPSRPCTLATAPRTSHGLAVDTLQALQPGYHLVHFYSHDQGDLERVTLTETLCDAAQLVRTHLAERLRPVHQVLQRERDGALAFLSGDAMLLTSIEPCEPCMPQVEPAVAAACHALRGGDLTALQRLFVLTPVIGLERCMA